MKSVGRYEVLGEIGRGGMGVVYLARQHGLNRLVALKELHSIHSTAPEIVKRFVRESRLAGSLNHPNIVTVHDYVEEDGTSYIAMEYMPRGSLRPWTGNMSLRQLAGVLEGLLAALSAVEPSGIVHRDLKPENVMVAGDGRIKITDFGIAKATQNANVASFMTATGTTVGTPAYMAPEQALSQTIGPWTDLYSLGIMTYEQLVGFLPFHDSPTPMAILLRHVNDPIPPVLDHCPDVDPALSEWVARLLIKEPTAGRTLSAAQAWEELEEIVLRLLGPRWRRDAFLPERDVANNLKPLTSAPVKSHHDAIRRGSSTLAGAPIALPSASAPPLAQPEVESDFLSYGRAPTGVDLPQSAIPEQSIRSSRASLRQESLTGLPTSSEQNSKRSLAESDREDKQLPITHRRGLVRAKDTPNSRARKLVAMVLLAVLTGAGGYELAPAGKSSRPPVSSRGTSSQLEESESSRAYATALSNAMSKLNRERAKEGPQLTRATTAQAQAAAARSLAHAQLQAATAVESSIPRPQERSVNAAIVTALAEIGRGYSVMASAAGRENRSEFNDGRTAVTASTASLAAAFAQLDKLGFQIRG